MRLIVAFLRLVRLPNLIFMALTQLLFQFCIYYPLYRGHIPEGDLTRFLLLLFAGGGRYSLDHLIINRKKNRKVQNSGIKASGALSSQPVFK